MPFKSAVALVTFAFIFLNVSPSNADDDIIFQENQIFYTTGQPNNKGNEDHTFFIEYQLTDSSAGEKFSVYTGCPIFHNDTVIGYDNIQKTPSSLTAQRYWHLDGIHLYFEDSQCRRGHIENNKVDSASRTAAYTILMHAIETTKPTFLAEMKYFYLHLSDADIAESLGFNI